MENIEHTFPLPETATHQLEEIENELQQRPVFQKMDDFLRIHRWRLVTAAGIFGLTFGLCMARRR